MHIKNAIRSTSEQESQHKWFPVVVLTVALISSIHRRPLTCQFRPTTDVGSRSHSHFPWYTCASGNIFNVCGLVSCEKSPLRCCFVYRLHFVYSVPFLLSFRWITFILLCHKQNNNRCTKCLPSNGVVWFSEPKFIYSLRLRSVSISISNWFN